MARKIFHERGYGGLIAFQISGATKPDIFRFMDKLAVINKATTLGDIYSQLLYPAISSHRDLTAEQREGLGIKDNLLRLSTGIENKDDLIEDLRQALN